MHSDSGRILVIAPDSQGTENAYVQRFIRAVAFAQRGV
jgi:hypothetical protein